MPAGKVAGRVFGGSRRCWGSRPDRLWAIAEAFRRGATVDEIYDRCKIDRWFLRNLEEIVEMEQALEAADESERVEWLRPAKQAGFSQEAYDKCLADKELFDKIVEVRKRAHEEFGVDSTPSFFINGKRLKGVGIDDFKAAIEGTGTADTPPSG